MSSGWAMQCDLCKKFEITNRMTVVGNWVTIKREGRERDYCSPTCLIQGEMQSTRTIESYVWKK